MRGLIDGKQAVSWCLVARALQHRTQNAAWGRTRNGSGGRYVQAQHTMSGAAHAAKLVARECKCVREERPSAFTGAKVELPQPNLEPTTKSGGRAQRQSGLTPRQAMFLPSSTAGPAFSDGQLERCDTFFYEVKLTGRSSHFAIHDSAS